jgi:hypothetical protein
VGLACGTGRIGLGLLATALTVLVLWQFRALEDRVAHHDMPAAPPPPFDPEPDPAPHNRRPPITED